MRGFTTEWGVWRRENAERRISLSMVVMGVLLIVLLESPLARAGDPAAVKTCPNATGGIVIGRDQIGTRWEGWGVSLGWWANWAGGLKPSERDKLVDLIFDPRKGLGLNVVRYNIGGGGYSAKDSQFKEAPLKFRATPGFRWGWRYRYNWDKDSNQRRILIGAKLRGANIFEAYSNSPPAWMTISKDFTGSRRRFEDNLSARHYTAFADYLTEVVRFYDKRWGVTFRTLEPFNEAYEGSWISGGIQEGCNFKAASMDRLIPIVAAKLRSKGLKTRVTAADSLAKNTPELLRKLSRATVREMYQINVHSYERRIIWTNYKRQVQYRQVVALLAARAGKKVAVSEAGPVSFRGTEMDIALSLARTIMLDINVMRAVSWSYWQAVEGFTGQPYWGLIYAQWTHAKPLRYRLRPQYFVVKQFSRWIAPGSVLLQVHSSCNYGLVAAYNEARRRLVVVVANYETAVQTVRLDVRFKALRGERSKVLRFRTTKGERYKFLGSGVAKLPSNGRVRLAPRSVTTYVWTRVEWE